MSYRYDSSELDFLYSTLKDTIKEYGIAQFMDIVNDALCSTFSDMVNEKTEDIISQYKSYKEKVDEMERLLNK